MLLKRAIKEDGLYRVELTLWRSGNEYHIIENELVPPCRKKIRAVHVGEEDANQAFDHYAEIGGYKMEK